MQLLELQNLIFVLPLAASFLLILVMALGIPLGDHGVHVDMDVSHGAHVGDLAHGGHGPHLPILGQVLGFLGIGRVPFAVTIITVSMVWGITGLAFNQVWSKPQHLWPVIFIAAAAAVLGTGSISNFIAAWMPSVETYSSKTSELTAKNAEVIHEINSNGGMVRLTDPQGNLRDVPAKTRPDQLPIARGCKVVLAEYDPATGVFLVNPDLSRPG